MNKSNAADRQLFARLLGRSARSADQFLRQADRLSPNIGGFKFSRLLEKETDKTRGPTGAGYPLAKSSLPRGRTERPGRNPNSGERMLAPCDQGPRSSPVLL